MVQQVSNPALQETQDTGDDQIILANTTISSELNLQCINTFSSKTTLNEHVIFPFVQ